MIHNEMPPVRTSSVNLRQRSTLIRLRDTVANLLDKHSNNMKEGAFKEIYEALHTATKSVCTLVWVRIRIAVPSLARNSEVSVLGLDPRVYIQEVTVQLQVERERLDTVKNVLNGTSLPHMSQVLSEKEFARQCVIASSDNYSEWRVLSLTLITL